MIKNNKIKKYNLTYTAKKLINSRIEQEVKII